MNNEAIGRFLWALRREKGWKQQEAAARLGVTDKTISKWETGRGLPDISALPEVAALYGVTVDELLAGARREAGSEKSAENTESTESAENGEGAVPEAQTSPAEVRPGETPAAKWAFRLFCAACILEGAAVIANGINAVLLRSYDFAFPYLNEIGLQALGDAALADRADAWVQQVLIPWQHTAQSLTMALLPLAAALLLWALGRRLPCKTVLRRALMPAVLSLGLSALALLPIWKTPHLFLDWATLYLYWFIALWGTVIVFLLYLVLYAAFRAARRRKTGGEESRRARIAAIASKPRMKKITAAVVLAVAAVCIVTTFTAANGGGHALYESGDVTVGIPRSYAADVLVLTEAPAVAGDSAVVWVYDKETWLSHAEKDAAAPTPGDAGWLFAIERAEEVDYEAHLMAVGEKDVAYFARDEGGAYYLCRFPLTDTLDAGRADYFSELREAVCSDFIRRNGLTAVDENELLERRYTYESQTHVVMTYAAGSTGEITLTLSRPATDGSGGIWCVERWSDSSGVHLNFPVESGLCARDYYAQMQMLCDEGERPDLLDSEEVALAFLTERNILVDHLSMSTGFMSEENHLLADMQQRSMRPLLEDTARGEVIALLSGDLEEEDLVYQSVELCARYPLTDTLTVSAWEVWFTIPDGIAVPAPLRPGSSDGGSRSVAAGFFLTVSEADGTETYLSYLPRTESRQASPRYADVAAAAADGGYVLLSNGTADAPDTYGPVSTATVEYAPFGADNETRYILTLTRPATDGEGGIWHVSRVRHAPGGDYVTYPFSGNTSFPEEIARTQVSSDADGDAYADWRDPKQVALKWLRDFAGEDAAAENITGFSQTDASYTTQSDELARRAEADMKDALLAQTDITPAQLEQVSFAHCGTGVAYGGLADTPVYAWRAACFIPEGIALPEGCAEGRYDGQRTACLGWYVRLPGAKGSSSWVLLPLSEYPDAPSYTDIAQRMGKYILPLPSPADA